MEEAGWTEIDEVSHTEYVKVTEELPGTNGSFQFPNSGIGDYWVGRGRTSSTSNMMYDLYMSPHHTYTNAANGSPVLWNGTSELVLHIPSSDSNTVAAMYRKIIGKNGTGHTPATQALDFDEDGNGDDKIVIECDLGANWSAQNPQMESGWIYILDNNLNTVALESFVVPQLYPYMDHVSIEAEGLGFSIGNPAGVYYIAIAFNVKPGNSNNTPIMVYVKNWKMTIYDEEEFAEQEVSNNTFTYQPHYRYGFQGQERDDEVTGTGNSYTAEYWQYDPRLGRRWNIDPIVYSSQSGYLTFNNNPIFFKDPVGLYGTRKEAREQKRAARKLGYDVGRIYKAGDEFLFNSSDEKGYYFNQATNFQFRYAWQNAGILALIPNFVGNHSGTTNDTETIGAERHESIFGDWPLNTNFLIELLGLQPKSSYKKTKDGTVLPDQGNRKRQVHDPNSRTYKNNEGSPSSGIGPNGQSIEITTDEDLKNQKDSVRFFYTKQIEGSSDSLNSSWSVPIDDSSSLVDFLKRKKEVKIDSTKRH